MSLENEILLRPRFKLGINKDNQEVLKTFEELQKKQTEFIINRIDNHVIIRFPKAKQHFWSPQLHIEIDEEGEKKSVIRGLFGPAPTVWTMFLFFHFIVAGLFIGFGVWAYSNWSLKNSYSLQLMGVLGMVILWIVLYIAGRIGKAKGKPEIKQLCKFLEDTLDLKDVKQQENCM